MNTLKKENALLDKIYNNYQEINELKAQAQVFLDKANKLEQESKELVSKDLKKLNKKSIENDLIILTLKKNKLNIKVSSPEDIPKEYLTMQPDEARIKKIAKKEIEEAEALGEEAELSIPGVTYSYTELAPKITLRTRESK